VWTHTGFFLLAPAVLAAGGVSAQNRETPNPASDFKFNAATGTITGYNGRDSRVVFPAAINGRAVTAIGNGAFAENTTVAEVVINDRIQTIGDEAFMDSGLRWIRIDGTSLRTIGKDAFGGTNLQSFISNWPRSITKIPDRLFVGTQLKGALVIPEGVTEIGLGAFSETKIQSVALPSTIKSIERAAFYYCTQLTTVTIPSSVKSITFGTPAPNVTVFGFTPLNAASMKAMKDRGYKEGF
jgi:hypothetical protein